MTSTRCAGVAGACLTAALLTGCTPFSPVAPAAEAAPSPAATSTVPDLVRDPGVAATDPPRPTDTDVVLSTASWDAGTATVQIGGYVSPLVEDGGTCTAELKRGDRTMTVEGPATPDASTTVCGGLEIAGAQLQPGSWQVVLSYASAQRSGSSAPMTVEVPQ
jgi:hypothetical protein